MTNANALRWDGSPGHYEVYYVSLTDPASGVGLWIRYTMVAPLPQTGEQASASLWLMAMDPEGEVIGRKASFPIDALISEPDPFQLRISDAVMSDRGMTGAFDDVAWDLKWEPRLPPAEHVHPLLARARIAKTILLLPHPDVEVSGTVRVGERELAIDGARAGQAHLWGSKHAARWAWAHCSDFTSLQGEPRPDTFVDGVSVFVPRLGRELGPNTPVVGRILGEDFRSTSPLRVTRNASSFALTSWRFEAIDGRRKIVGEVDARREDLVGVTYHDPDGELAYCYNSEVASMRLFVWERTGRGADGWTLRDTLQSDGHAHFEYAQRDPVAGLTLHIA